MQKYFKFLLNNIVTLIVLLIVVFLSSYVLCEFINKKTSYYEATIKVEKIEQYDYEKLTNFEYLYSIQQSNEKYNNIDVSKIIKENGLNYTINKDEIVIQTKYEYYDIFFFSSKKTVGTRAKTFIKDCALGLENENAKVSFADKENIVTLKNHINSWFISLYVVLSSIVIELIVMAIIFIKKPKEEEIEEKSNSIFPALRKDYWKSALVPLIKIKDITTLAMIFALMIVCKFIPIPSGFGDLGLSFTYLFFAISAMIYGPIYGFVIGVFSDLIGFVIMPKGPFFPLYTLQAALTGFIYGLCLFKTKFTFSKALLARILVNMLMNVVFGSLCFGLLYDYDFSTTMSYLVLISLPKNVLYLLPQTLLLYLVIKALLPILQRFKYID